MFRAGHGRNYNRKKLLHMSATRACVIRLFQLKSSGSSTSLPAVTKVDGLPPVPIGICSVQPRRRRCKRIVGSRERARKRLCAQRRFLCIWVVTRRASRRAKRRSLRVIRKRWWASWPAPFRRIHFGVPRGGSGDLEI